MFIFCYICNALHIVGILKFLLAVITNIYFVIIDYFHVQFVVNKPQSTDHNAKFLKLPTRPIVTMVVCWSTACRISLFSHVQLQPVTICVCLIDSVQPCPDVKYGKRMHILPIDDTVEGLTG